MFDGIWAGFVAPNGPWFLHVLKRKTDKNNKELYSFTESSTIFLNIVSKTQSIVGLYTWKIQLLAKYLWVSVSKWVTGKMCLTAFAEMFNLSEVYRVLRMRLAQLKAVARKSREEKSWGKVARKSRQEQSPGIITRHSRDGVQRWKSFLYDK